LTKRFTQKNNIPVLSINTDLDSPDSSFHDFIRQAKAAVEDQADPGAKCGLNLVGFPPNRGKQELVAALDAMSIPINVSILPDIGIDVLKCYLKGEASIVYPHRAWQEVVETLFDDSAVAWQVLAAPYGYKRTIEWYRAVAGTMKQAELAESYLEQHQDQFLQHWTRLCEQASSFRLAFVVDSSILERLYTPAKHYGFEILPLLEEMGFAVDVLIRGEISDEDTAISDLQAALQTPERHSFTSFNSIEELSELLGQGEFQAVYSEVFFDTRLSRAGKAQFNLSMIEMGLAGALRSIKRLLGVCRWQFYSKYRRYLGDN